MIATLFICGVLTLASFVSLVITIIRTKRMHGKYLYTDWEDDTYAMEVWSTSSGKRKCYKFVKKGE